MIRRYQRAMASFTTLFFMVAVVSCACGTAASARVSGSISVGDHACCKTNEDQPAAPAPTHGSCAHCGHLSFAPAASIDAAPALTLASFAKPCDTCTDFAAIPSPLSQIRTSFVSPPDLLSLCCALRL